MVSLHPYVDRRHITTIIRMRTGHCLTKLHLFNIGIESNPYCECGQIEDLNHIFFECPINKDSQFDIYNLLVKANNSNPMSIKTVLRNPTIETIRILIRFLLTFHHLV